MSPECVVAMQIACHTPCTTEESTLRCFVTVPAHRRTVSFAVTLVSLVLSTCEGCELALQACALVFSRMPSYRARTRACTHACTQPYIRACARTWTSTFAGFRSAVEGRAGWGKARARKCQGVAGRSHCTPLEGHSLPLPRASTNQHALAATPCQAGSPSTSMQAWHATSFPHRRG